MDIYLRSQAKIIDAVQYTGQEHELIKRITYDADKNVIVDPERSFDSFKAVKTYNGWEKINKTDWIVKKGQKIFVIEDKIFQIMFEVN